MMELAAPLDRDLIKAIGALSTQLQIPVEEVADIYRMEFDRLARVARIPTYLGVLAMNNARSILRRSARSATIR
jgi:hypothetical protein